MAQASAYMEKAENQFKNHEVMFRNQDASIQNIKNQLGQISKQLAERPQGSLPSDTIPNPREHVKAITLRSGKSLAEPGIKSHQLQKNEKKSDSDNIIVPSLANEKYEIPMRRDKGKEKEAEISENFSPSTVHDPPLLNPQRLK